MMMTRIVMMLMIIIKIFGDDMLVHCPRYLVVHLHVELVQVLRAELKQVLRESCLLHIISLLVGLYWNSCNCVLCIGLSIWTMYLVVVDKSADNVNRLRSLSSLCAAL